MVDYRVVFHIDEDDESRVLLLLSNVRNLMEDLESVRIEVVAYSMGVNALRRDSEYSEDIAELIGQGVMFCACSNTLRASYIDVSDLLEGVQVVSSGVGQIVRRQTEGWAYIRP